MWRQSVERVAPAGGGETAKSHRNFNTGVPAGNYTQTGYYVKVLMESFQ